jgi:copper chaperone CopZ
MFHPSLRAWRIRAGCIVAALGMALAGCGPAGGPEAPPKEAATTPPVQAAPPAIEPGPGPAGGEQVYRPQEPLERGDRAKVANAQTRRLKIEGLEDANAQKAVAERLKAIAGVGHVTVDAETGIAEVVFDQAQVTIERIVERFNAKGAFSATLTE